MTGFILPLLIMEIPAGVVLFIISRRKNLSLGRPLAYGFLICLTALGAAALGGELFRTAAGDWHPPQKELFTALIQAFVLAALIEEGLRWIALNLYFTPAQKGRSGERSVLWATVTGIGFGMMENLFYLGEPLGVIISRTFWVLPLHGAAAALMGYFLSVPGSRRGRIRRGSALLIPLMLHGCYNFLLMREGIMVWGGPVVSLTAVGLAGAAIRKARNDDFG